MKKIIVSFLFFITLSTPCLAQEKLKIGTLPIADTLLLHVAQREKFFKEEGLEVELIPFQGFVEKNAAVQAGALDGHFCEISAVILQKAAKLPYTVIATTSHSNSKNRVFGLVSSPKHKDATLEDLKGLSLGTSRLAIVDFLSDVFFEKAGKSTDFMQRKTLNKIPVRMQMLSSNKIDAAVLPEPLLSIAEKAGGKVLLDDRNLSMPLASIALRDDLATPERVEAFRKALAKAAVAINGDSEKYRKLLFDLRLIPPQLSTDYHMAEIDLSLIPYSLPSAELYQDYINWLIKNKALANKYEDGGPPPAPLYEEVIWQGTK